MFHPRVYFGLALVRLGGLIQSLAVNVMKPRDLIALNRRFYAEPENIRYWSDPELIDSGLYPLEQSTCDQIPVQEGRLLLLGLGGGREAFYFIRRGFEVTGIDFVPEMVARAETKARELGLPITALEQESSNLDVPDASFEVAWVSCATYSSIPGREQRIALLKRLKRALVNGGYLACSFSLNPRLIVSRKTAWIRKLITFLTLGNFSYQKGDRLHGWREFLHDFGSEAEIQEELESGGYKTLHLSVNSDGGWSLAVARKQP